MTAARPFAPVGRALSSAQLTQVADIVHRGSGIALTEAKASLVASRLGRRMSSLKLDDLDDYIAYIARPEGAVERKRMLNALTTNVTRFFREPHHFEHLATVALPGLLAGARRGDRVRIWSAGCASGEEAYSIALSVLVAEPLADSLDIRILATDLDPTVLDRGRHGLYPDAAFASDVGGRADGFFLTETGGRRARPRLRRMIRFRELNLIERWPMVGPLDIIFCRNVLIYFDAKTQSAILRGFARLTAPGAYLYLGHSERVGPAEANLFQRAGQTTYVRI